MFLGRIPSIVGILALTNGALARVIDDGIRELPPGHEAVQTIGEGMAVTASHMVRKPVTLEYPDRLPGNVTTPGLHALMHCILAYRSLPPLARPLAQACRCRHRPVSVRPLPAQAVPLMPLVRPGSRPAISGRCVHWKQNARPRNLKHCPTRRRHRSL
jgi:hypothetical protein